MLNRLRNLKIGARLGAGFAAVIALVIAVAGVGVSRIDAIEQAAIVQIELSSVQAQTEIATHGLTSQAARSFIERLPSVEELMKPLDFGAIAGDADPPVVEQLLSLNALRQKRYRDRQKTLRDANVTPALTTPHPETDEATP